MIQVTFMDISSGTRNFLSCCEYSQLKKKSIDNIDPSVLSATHTGQEGKAWHPAS
jgi:hypothetical protein